MLNKGEESLRIAGMRLIQVNDLPVTLPTVLRIAGMRLIQVNVLPVTLLTVPYQRVEGIRCTVSSICLVCCCFFWQKSLTSSGDVQYNLRMCVAVKRRLQVLLLFNG